MKKYMIVITCIGLIIASIIVYSILQVNSENSNIFCESGYILQSKMEQTTQEIERFYFNANENYKKYYNHKVVFEDTSGERISVERSNFLHYSNGSISSFSKGVILDFAQINQDPILYYTIQENKVLNKNGEKYTIKHLNKQLEFTNFIWKIAEQKYLICGMPLTISFPNGEKKEIKGYVELEYTDNEVVKIYNQEATFQTISSNLYITLPEEIKINVSNKIVSQNGENKLSLDNMVIDAEDNVEIVDIQDEKYQEKKEEQEENKTEENSAKEDEINESESKQNQTSQNPVTLNNNTQAQNRVDRNEVNSNKNQTQNENPSGNQGQTQMQNPANIQNQTNKGSINGNINTNTQVGDSITANGDDKQDDADTENDNNQETIVEDTPKVSAPVFKVEEFDVNSISMSAKITIQDEESTLIGAPVVRIMKNDTGKIVYENEETQGTFVLDVSVSSLMPDEEYTLVVQATYQVEEAQYTKNFIYKIFRTKAVGIDFEKDYFTNNTLAFEVQLEEDSKVKSAEMVLMDTVRRSNRNEKN